MTLSRREFIQVAAALGASLAWGGNARASRVKWRERRDLYPEGVASGDPDPNSVILWTRRPFGDGERHMLTVEVAEDEHFRRVVAHAPAPVSAAADWTARVLVGGLKPSRVYWYRFTDADGNGSRVGRTITAPTTNDPRPVNFAFVSCQDVNEGKLNAYRRMIFEDERAAPREPARFRPAPRRLHLRGRRISRRSEDAVRPHDLRGRADPRWRQDRQVPLSADGRRLPRRLSRLSRRSGPAGCEGPLAVRGDVGQSRILLAGVAKHPEGRRTRTPGTEHQGRRQPGLVRISARARRSAERIARGVRTADGQGCADRAMG